jgi:hypothetical protein
MCLVRDGMVKSLVAPEFYHGKNPESLLEITPIGCQQWDFTKPKPNHCSLDLNFAEIRLASGTNCQAVKLSEHDKYSN